MANVNSNGCNHLIPKYLQIRELIELRGSLIALRLIERGLHIIAETVAVWAGKIAYQRRVYGTPFEETCGPG